MNKNYGALSLLVAIVIIPLTQVQGSANKMNLPQKQENVPKFELLSLSGINIAPPKKVLPQGLVALNLAIVGGKNSDRIDKIMEKLAFCESGSDPTKINWNDNGSPSFGKYQFKKTTFSSMGKKYNLPATDIMNEEQQEAIVFQMLLNGESSHWKNCMSKIK